MKQKICIIGLGYIGLPTAAMFATHGHSIVGVDVNEVVVNAINQGKIVIEEPYLDIMVQAAVTSGNLRAQTYPEEADVFIIAVPTPITEDKKADMSYVEQAANSIVPYLKPGNTVILESTSPPGTVYDLLIPILEKSSLKIGDELFVAHSPERVLPGRILVELVENNRIIGGINEKSCEIVKSLYSTFVRGEIFLTDARTAEMCKLMENTYRDVNIALVNELSIICERLGINVWEVVRICNKHPRVNLHLPGPGVGGHCLAVDPWFIVENNRQDANLIKMAREINDNMPIRVYNKIKKLTQNISNPKVIILGITYKADVDDLRESPILKIIDLLEKDKNIEISIVDPHIKNFKYLNNNLFEAVKCADLIVLGVNHQEFKEIDFNMLLKHMRNYIILDTRNMWSQKELEALGFNYYLLGNGTNNSNS
ncbi:UDP-N-acetyl-D-mannosamine dehydrogenase [Defluviitalea saccharophila]|uniref:UDP-N-acetyl-D-mannosamine dehydrogenase n=1 Tax=Defluviitalea saccharophila TaxID=879970 RepID=A0ABZ2Y2R2_9FIRM